MFYVVIAHKNTQLIITTTEDNIDKGGNAITNKDQLLLGGGSQ